MVISRVAKTARFSAAPGDAGYFGCFAAVVPHKGMASIACASVGMAETGCLLTRNLAIAIIRHVTNEIFGAYRSFPVLSSA